MNRLIIASLALSICSAVACQPKSALQSHQSEPGPAPKTSTATPPAPQKVLSGKEQACEISKKSHNRNEVQHILETKTVSIERHYQRVVRTTCEGKPISDKIETVKSPLQDVKLESPVKTPFQSVFVFSETTCDHKLTVMPVGDSFMEKITTGALYNVTGDGKKSITIKGDVANALLTFELAPGLNNIYVDFHTDCAPSKVSSNNNARVGEATCEESSKTVKALYPIEVKYKEVTLEGQKDIKQDEKGGACPAPGRKT